MKVIVPFTSHLVRAFQIPPKRKAGKEKMMSGEALVIGVLVVAAFLGVVAWRAVPSRKG
jgi:hypothetical protein